MVWIKVRRVLVANFKCINCLFEMKDSPIPIVSLKRKNYRRIYEDLRQRGYGRPSGLQRAITIYLILLLIGQIFRSLFLVFFVKNDTDMWNTWFGSYFALVHSNRKHTETTAVFFSTYPSLLLALMLGRSKFYLFMKIVLQYGKQIFDPQRDMFVYDRRKLKALRMPTASLNKLYHKSRRLYFLISSFSLCFLLVVFIVSFSSILFGDYRNMNMSMFENSWTRYLYATIAALGWAYWSFTCVRIMLYVFYHFISVTDILKCKICIIEQDLNRLNRGKNPQNFTAGLVVQLRKEAALFDEISQVNQFWSQYISITNTLCTLIICYLMYLVLITDAAYFTKIMFGAACSMPLTFLVGTTLIASGLYNRILNHYKTTSVILARQTVHPLLQLKIQSTLNLISQKSIGFTYLDRRIIESDTLVKVCQG